MLFLGCRWFFLVCFARRKRSAKHNCDKTQPKYNTKNLKKKKQQTYKMPISSFYFIFSIHIIYFKSTSRITKKRSKFSRCLLMLVDLFSCLFFCRSFTRSANQSRCVMIIFLVYLLFIFICKLLPYKLTEFRRRFDFVVGKSCCCCCFLCSLLLIWNLLFFFVQITLEWQRHKNKY